MDRRRVIPSALLGILTILTALAAVWAVRSPSITATQKVQSATAATFGTPLGSTSFSMDLTSSISASSGAGIISQVQFITFTEPDRMSVYKTTPELTLLGRESPAAIRNDLDEYVAFVGGHTPWTGQGSSFHRMESLPTFVARVKPSQFDQGQPVSGQVYESAVVRDGFLVKLQVNLIVPQQVLGGGKLTAGGLQQEVFHLLDINGSPAPPVHP
jgi:hypothetical protein